MTNTEALKMARDALALNADLDPQTPIVERLAKTRAALAAIDALQSTHHADASKSGAQIDMAQHSAPAGLAERVQAALSMPACDRLREWAAIGPAQLAAVESLAELVLLWERGAKAWAGVDPQALRDGQPSAPSGEPLRRGSTGVCSRKNCECERARLGNQCIWLRPTDAELQRRTGEPHIDGWPLYSGLPPPQAVHTAAAPQAQAVRAPNVGGNRKTTA